MVNLVTGSGGFVGKHFADKIPFLPLATEDGCKIDIRDETALNEFCALHRFDRVVHLASQSFVPKSFEDPLETFAVNFLGTYNLLGALKKHAFAGRFLFVGSGDEYGLVNEDRLPIREDLPVKPRSPYSVSKVAAEALCYQWSQTETFQVVLARPFNHIGPGQSDRFVISNLAKQIIEIKRGTREPVLRVGDLEVTRDFTDVRDIISAYLLLLEEGKNGEVYNICSGREIKISTLLRMLLEISGVSADIEVDVSRLRTAEQRRVAGCFEKLNRDTGWEPKIQIEESLTDILQHWERTLS
jgi:GDP-4-dehydro-6-deoxy-D-mannose reductase